MYERGLTILFFVIFFIFIIIFSLSAILIIVYLPENIERVNIREAVADTSLSISDINVSDNILSFNIEKLSGDLDTDGVKIYLQDDFGNNDLYEFPITLRNNESKRLGLDLSKSSLDTISKFQIYPVFKSRSGQNISGERPANASLGHSRGGGGSGGGGGRGGGGSGGGGSGGGSSSVCGNNIIEAGEQCDDGNTNNGDGCSSTCVIEPSCSLNSAYWSLNNAVQGQIVNLIVNGTNCNGQSINFTIFEDDIAFDEQVSINPAPVSFIGNSVSTTWTAEWQCDGNIGGVCTLGNPEYYFIARLVNNSLISITSSNYLITSSLSPTCGNNITESGEQCDDGNTNNGDSCTNLCLNAFCGDNIIWIGNEICDGNSQSCSINNYTGTQTCNSQCNGFNTCVTTQYCGDGIINGPETCDDGNTNNGDGCSSTCQIEQQLQTSLFFEAENGSLTGPYSVSNGALMLNGTNARATYTFNLTEAGTYIISAYVDAPSTFENSFLINIDSDPIEPTNVWDIYPYPTLGFKLRNVSWRGNGLPDSNQFVPKNFSLNQGVHQIRLWGREPNTRIDNFTLIKLIAPAPSVCGNNITESGEICDGNSQSCLINNYTGTQTCNSQCNGFNTCVTTQYCGDGIINGPETCDDGNTNNGDGCSSTCQHECIDSDG
ncbi:MAG: DUF4215 domain-containing protein, partial [Candidatus Pacearchaeota archaeon]